MRTKYKVMKILFEKTFLNFIKCKTSGGIIHEAVS